MLGTTAARRVASRRTGALLQSVVQRQEARGLSLFPNPHTQASDKSENSVDPEQSRLNKVSRGLSSVFQGAQRPAPVDPRFEVISSGHGSLVVAKMPPYSQLYAQVGQALGVSVGAQSRATFRGAAVVAALRPLLGRKCFVQEITTEERAAEVMLAPKLPGDVAVVGMSGAVDYYMRRGSVLAQSRFLSISTWAGIGAGFNALAFDRVAGRGSAVINAVGGLHRLVLAEGEEYLVDPRFVVAWSSGLQIEPLSGRPQPWSSNTKAVSKEPPVSSEASTHVDGTASSAARAVPLVSKNPAISNTVASPARSPAEPVQAAKASSLGGKGGIRGIGSKILDAGIHPLWRAIKAGTSRALYASANVVRINAWTAGKTTRTLAGVPDLYRVVGPGDIYVTTRLTPKPWTRISQTISAKSSAE
ncbi:hypothetical protein H4R20_002576 [Coemansia guatemalensis]|uniref:Altered inheritance of mitochondria protein 24, mitochondrial n=1 Tax=Coemansia guatemalensis TaxID=2761395 RepID=A0A9W8I168_9FUNG|nr:hypothetical protein H4R20_002576 [Coemansia guatemalensis]